MSAILLRASSFSPASWAVTRQRISDVGLAMAAIQLRRPEEDVEIKISEELQTTKHSPRPGLQTAGGDEIRKHGTFNLLRTHCAACC